MNWLHSLPLRYVLPVLLGSFAVLISGLAYQVTRPDAIRNVEREAMDRMTATLTESQGALEHLWHGGDLDGVRSLIATYGTVRGESVTVLVGHDGVIIASTSLREIGQTATTIYPSLNQSILAEIGITGGANVTFTDNRSSIVGYAQVCGPDLTNLRSRACGYLYHEKSLVDQTAAAVGLLRAQTLESVIAIGTTTVIFLVLLNFLITRRAQRLVTSARAFARGDTEVRTALQGGDEFAEVGRAFDAMLDTVVLNHAELQRTEKALRESHEVLEQRVAERTAELTQAHDALKASEQDLACIIDSSPDATLIVNDEGQIERVNEQAIQLFGYRRDEMHDEPIELLIPQRLHRQHLAKRTAYNENPQARSMGSGLDLFAQRKDGSEFPIDVNLSPVRLRGRVVVAAAVRDISEQQAIEGALSSAMAEAERANAGKSRFLAAASHDLRQPLQSIGLYMSVLSRLLEHPKEQEISEKIRKSLDVMGELLDALLDISKLDGGAITPTVSHFPIQTLLDKVIADNEPPANEKGLELRCADSPCVVYSDPALLERIVENFVTNALRYTETGYVEIRCESLKDKVRIEVEDSGIGMPKAALETIYEEYYQLDNDVRDRSKGLGLGLSIVKHIARLLDHQLDVASTPGKGSTFSVEVPLGKSTEVPIDSALRATASIQHDREPVVLFVDDDPAIVDATTMLLKVAGIEVHSALSGDEALAHIAAGVRPDLVVSDYRLPGYDGVEVIRRVRRATVEDMPTILMTGDTSSKEIESANLSNCTLLHKPVDTEQLINLIESLST